MKTPLFLAAVTLALAFTAYADDQLRNVQTQLKNQGFYYGDVDGQSSAETTSAVRRYQIRNGLEVTGTLTAETINSLGLASTHKKQPAPATTAQNPPKSTKPSGPVNIRRDDSVEQSDKDFLKNEEARDQGKPPKGDFFQGEPAPRYSSIPPVAPHDSVVVTPVPPAPGAPRDAYVVPPPAPLDAPSADFPVLFAGTPYSNAPETVQRNTLRRAQSVLYVQGFYHDIIDGLPGPSTEEALLTFQRAARLTLSGRLDLDTLNKLRLLPGDNGNVRQGPSVQFGVEFGGPRHCYRGIWVQRD